MQDIKETLARYTQHKIECGGFLMAVLRNDLMEAVGRADEQNVRRLREICQYIYCELPSNCWGSPEKVRAFLND